MPSRLVMQVISVFSLLLKTTSCSSVLHHFISCSGDIQCDSWKLQSSWTQGGYAAICNARDSNEQDRNLLLRVYLIRNTYYCSSSTGKAIRIVNNYFDEVGKLCHLASGEDICSGTSENIEDSWIKVSLFCGEYICQFHYHKCDVCPLIPWYSWSVQRRSRLERIRPISCKAQLSYIKGNTSHVSCLRCDGALVSRKYCEPEVSGKYFLDLKELKPSWSEWKSTTGCNVTGSNYSMCRNNLKFGNMTWKRFCHYPNHPVRLDPKYCESQVGDTMIRLCNITTLQCPTSVRTKRKGYYSKASNVWIAIIVIATIILVVSVLFIFIKYGQFRSGKDTLFTAGLFSSCATQTSPKYSPRRIITEPEYALLGDWRQNVVQCPQPESNGIDPIYWGFEHDRLSDDELNDLDSPVHAVAKECCELDADSKRALYAKTHRWR